MNIVYFQHRQKIKLTTKYIRKRKEILPQYLFIVKGAYFEFSIHVNETKTY